MDELDHKVKGAEENTDHPSISNEELTILMAIVKDKFSELSRTIQEISKDTNIPVGLITREVTLYLRMKIVIEGFLDPTVPMKETRRIAGVSPATANRYLNDERRIKGYFGEDIYLNIQTCLNKPLTEPERNARLANIVREYLKSNVTIEQLAELTKYSRSTIQRDLNDHERIIRVFKEKGEEIYSLIQRKLALSLEQGKINGGQSFAQNNIPTREDHGRFSGSNHK